MWLTFLKAADVFDESEVGRIIHRRMIISPLSAVKHPLDWHTDSQGFIVYNSANDSGVSQLFSCPSPIPLLYSAVF